MRTTGDDSTGSLPPSRSSNPFATCWTRPGALPFQFDEGLTAAQLVGSLAANNWWGEIIGPHGSGKSTLLEALKPVLLDAGCQFHAVTLRNGQCRLPADAARWTRDSTNHRRRVVIVDGYEQLGWFAKQLLKRRLRRANVGLLVTAHLPSGLPTLVALAPNLQLIQQLAALLAARTATCVSPADVVASHAVRGSNLREIFFDLYDRHEQRRNVG